jgi:hypothetical protein
VYRSGRERGRLIIVVRWWRGRARGLRIHYWRSNVKSVNLLRKCQKGWGTANSNRRNRRSPIDLITG